MKSYNKAIIPYARQLRKNMTPWERKIWFEFLRNYPVRFQKQKTIGNYIADFYCAKATLILELDGGEHYKQAQEERDQVRTAALKAIGIKVIRICNLDIDRNFKGVCEMIDMEVGNSIKK
jgi:very-short-patch-repair endonuclease